jgi:hypothetical protein
VLRTTPRTASAPDTPKLLVLLCPEFVLLEVQVLVVALTLTAHDNIPPVAVAVCRALRSLTSSKAHPVPLLGSNQLLIAVRGALTLHPGLHDVALPACAILHNLARANPGAAHKRTLRALIPEQMLSDVVNAHPGSEAAAFARSVLSVLAQH